MHFMLSSVAFCVCCRARSCKDGVHALSSGVALRRWGGPARVFFLWGYKSNLSDPVHGHKSILLGSRWKILETLLDHGRVLETLLGHNKKEKRTFVISQRCSPSSRAARVARRAFVLAAHGMGLPCSSMWKDSTQRYKKSCAYTCATIYKLQRAETRREHYREP